MYHAHPTVDRHGNRHAYFTDIFPQLGRAAQIQPRALSTTEPFMV